MSKKDLNLKEAIVKYVGPSEYSYISAEGMNQLVSGFDPKEPEKNLVWTTDINVELPIVMRSRGPGSEAPQTIPEVIELRVKEFGKYNALAHKIDKKWKFWNYEEFYREVRTFGNAVMSLEIPSFKSINIIGWNHPAWFFSFYGALFANVLPVGVYNTNGPEACHYIAEHSEAQAILVENKEHLDKYLAVWDRLPELKCIIVYNEKVPADLPEKFKGKVITWKEFMDRGVKYAKETKEEPLVKRMKTQKPGNCCTLVYTSGTTGNPKGVMLSHDNYTWLVHTYRENAYYEYSQLVPPGKGRTVSYLPLCHVAAQFAELVGPILNGICVFFAEPTALSGSLIETLREVRPTHMVSVPRIWEKIEETLKRISVQNSWAKKKIAEWAKGIGIQGTFAEMTNAPKPFAWDIAKLLVYNNVRKALGMDKTIMLNYGAAPLHINSRKYFASLNMFLNNVYGMSETAGPETYYSPFTGAPPSLDSAGMAVPGAEFMIDNPDKDGNGEICFKGRNRFMGYLKDPVNTKKTIDAKGYLHSGDVGHLDKHGHLFITGRIKELLITAGGENVAPLLIEAEIKNALPELSQVVVIGDNKKYLSVLLTLKHKMEKIGYPTKEIDQMTLQDLQHKGIKGKTPQELRHDPAFIKYVEEGLAKANANAISRAQTVKRWYLLERDFSIENDEITPTMKLKRNKISKNYENEIESMYQEPKL